MACAAPQTLTSSASFSALPLSSAVGQALVPGPARCAQAGQRIELRQTLLDRPFAERAGVFAQVGGRAALADLGQRADGGDDVVARQGDYVGRHMRLQAAPQRAQRRLDVDLAALLQVQLIGSVLGQELA